MEEVEEAWGVAANVVSLALDNRDRPHVCYGGDEMVYAWRDDSGWQAEKIAGDTQIDSLSLALDSAGNPHVSYVHDDSGTYYLEYAWRGNQ